VLVATTPGRILVKFWIEKVRDLLLIEQPGALAAIDLHRRYIGLDSDRLSGRSDLHSQRPHGQSVRRIQYDVPLGEALKSPSIYRYYEGAWLHGHEDEFSLSVCGRRPLFCIKLVLERDLSANDQLASRVNNSPIDLTARGLC
jgi:hypothetical protein